jgi:hypothetical protein
MTAVTFALGGLAWAVIQPLGLLWVRHRRPNDPFGFYTFAVFGILLHGAVFAPNGSSIKTYAVLSTVGLASYVLLSGVMGFVRDGRAVISIAGFSIASLLPVFAAAFSLHGLPYRYNPLFLPPYVARLLSLQEGGLYRSYSLGPLPGPDFAAPVKLSSLDNLDAINPTETAKFMEDYLDSSLSALYFVGQSSAHGPPPVSALDQIKQNRRFYDLVAVKYFVTMAGPDPNVYDSLAVFLGSAQPVPITKPLRSFYNVTGSEITTIQVLIGTYGRMNPGVLEMQVFDQDDTLLESSQVPGMGLANNSFCKFQFSSLKNVKRKRLRLDLSFRPNSQDSMVAAYVPPDPSYIGFAFRVPSTDEDFRMAYDDQETATVIWENAAATPRVFLAPEIHIISSPRDALSRLKDIPDLTRTVLVENADLTHPDPDKSRPAGVLREFRMSPNEVSIKYSAGVPGILTVVDSFSDGWHAEINGNETPVLRVDGVFRGVKVDNPGELSVRFWYRPPRWNLSLVLSCLGLIVLSLSLLRLKVPWDFKNISS